MEKPWYSSLSSCISSCAGKRDRGRDQSCQVTQEKPAPSTLAPPSIVRSQPQLQPRPTYYPTWHSQTHTQTWPVLPLHRMNWNQYFALHHRSPTVITTASGPGQRRKGSIRPPQISGPTDFRHVARQDVDTFSWSPKEEARDELAASIQRPQRASYQPLELSIYLPNNSLSPLWPHFGLPVPQEDENEDDHDDTIISRPSTSKDVRISTTTATTNAPGIAPPPAAVLADARDDAYVLSQQRSTSAMSFHLPRRVNSQSLSRQGSKRSVATTTTPDVSSVYKRIASAMADLERLQDRIEEVAERQSMCLGGETDGFALLRQSLNRLPPIPALPEGDGPSFTERLRPQSRFNPHTMVLLRRPQTTLSNSIIVGGPDSAAAVLSSVPELLHETSFTSTADDVPAGEARLSLRPLSRVHLAALSPASYRSLISEMPVSGLSGSEAAAWYHDMASDVEMEDKDSEDDLNDDSEEQYDDDDIVDMSCRISELVQTDPLTAVVAVSKRPQAVVTRRKRSQQSWGSAKQRPTSSAVTSRSADRTTAGAGQRPFIIHDSAPQTLTYATLLSPFTLAAEPSSFPTPPPRPIPPLRKKRSLSSLDWHLAHSRSLSSSLSVSASSARPLTMPVSYADNHNNNASTKSSTSSRSSMDSLSTSSTITTADDYHIDVISTTLPAALQQQRLSYVSASDDSEVFVAIDAVAADESFLDALGEDAHVESARNSKHLSFDFDLLQQGQRISMSFEPAAYDHQRDRFLSPVQGVVRPKSVGIAQ